METTDQVKVITTKEEFDDRKETKEESPEVIYSESPEASKSSEVSSDSQDEILKAPRTNTNVVIKLLFFSQDVNVSSGFDVNKDLANEDPVTAADASAPDQVECEAEAKAGYTRIVEKNGNINVAVKRRKGFGFLTLYDYSILLSMDWVSFLMVSFLAFALSCAFFGLLILQLQRVHTVDEEKMSTQERDAWLKRFNTKYFDYPTCFPEVEYFGDAYLFALETLTTIGYGTKYPNPGCPEAVIMTMGMSLWSLMLTALFVGIFLAKFTLRTSTSRIRFSSRALVGKIDGSLFLMFRIADPMASGSDILEVNAFVCRNEPESLDDNSTISDVRITHLGKLACSCTIRGAVHSRIPLMWPMVIYHKMDESSPLYNLDPLKLKVDNFEIIVKVSGVRSESGGTIFSTTSYNNNEITWGEFFDEDVVLFRRQEGVREEDFFNLASFGQEDIDQVETDSKDITPLLSARALAESKK